MIFEEFEKNVDYYKEIKDLLKTIRGNLQKGRDFGSGKLPLKRIGKIILILLFLSSQVYLASAFEAHVVNVTAHICNFSETRTMGFWKNHPCVYANCLPQFLGDYPADFPVNTEDDVNVIFDAANASEMRDMLRGQLLAMKFNVCAFGIDPYEGESFGGYTLNELVEWADNLLRDPNSTREDEELAKNLLDRANSLEQLRYCSTQPSWLTPALAEKPEKDKELKDKNSTSTEDLEILLAEKGLLGEGQVLGEGLLTEEISEEESTTSEEALNGEEPFDEAQGEPLVEGEPFDETQGKPLVEREPFDEAQGEPPVEEEPPAEEEPLDEGPSTEEEPPAEDPPAEESPVEEEPPA